MTDAGPASEPDALRELTPQQRQIVRLASAGLTDREIGDRLFLSPRTVARTCTGPIPSSGRHPLPTPRRDSPGRGPLTEVQ